MRDLRKVEIRLAYAMPIAAAAAFVGFLGFVVEQSSYHSRVAPLLLAFLLTVLAPFLVYSVLGLVAFYAAKQNSGIMTSLLWILLLPAWYVSAFLFIFVQFSEGLYAVLYYGPAPLVAVVAAIVSLSARIAAHRNRRC